MRPVIYFSVLTILSLMVLFAQIASAASDFAHPGTEKSADCETRSAGQGGIAWGSVLSPDGERGTIHPDKPVSVDQFATGSESPLFGALRTSEVPSTLGARDAGVDKHQLEVEDKRANAFVGLAPQSGTKKVPLRNEVALIALIVAVHAAVTWDAQSTNHFFHHYPVGYRPAEVDPIMRPFAGKALMYPMANLCFAVPIDLALLRTRHSNTSIRAMAYAAATTWMGMEIRQSLINIGNEHIKSGK